MSDPTPEERATRLVGVAADSTTTRSADRAMREDSDLWRIFRDEIQQAEECARKAARGQGVVVAALCPQCSGHGGWAHVARQCDTTETVVVCPCCDGQRVVFVHADGPVRELRRFGHQASDDIDRDEGP